jgi:hypothetical protein
MFTTSVGTHIKKGQRLFHEGQGGSGQSDKSLNDKE